MKKSFFPHALSGFVVGLFFIFQSINAQSPPDGFDPNINGTVRSIAVQPDGKIIIGGFFTMQSDGKVLIGGTFGNVGGQLRGNIARPDAATGQPYYLQSSNFKFCYSLSLRDLLPLPMIS